MENISNDELNKISLFIKSCDDMINGKFILADVKILKILNMIANSEALYRYIQECMIDFNFEKEFNRAEVKNRFNNGTFVPPTENKSLVAMVFSLLVEFDKKRLDFYSFINTNFATLTPGGEYANFARTLLVPFKEIIGEHFGLVKRNPEPEIKNPFTQHSNENLDKLNTNKTEQIDENNFKEEQLDENSGKTEFEIAEEKVWKDLPILVDSIMNCVMTDRKIKSNTKDSLIYILKSIKYSAKYKDMRVVSALLTCVDILTAKSNTIKFIVSDLKNEIMDYYNKARN